MIRGERPHSFPMPCPVRLLIALVLMAALAVSPGRAQDAAGAFSTQPVLVQVGPWPSSHLPSAVLAPRRSNAPEGTLSPTQRADSTRTGRTRRDRRVLGGLHLAVGAIGLGGGTFTGVGAYKLIRTRSDSELDILGHALGGVLLVGAAALIGTGIYMTIRGIRILRGEDPPVDWGPQPPPSPPPRFPSPSPRQHSGLTITVSL